MNLISFKDKFPKFGRLLLYDKRSDYYTVYTFGEAYLEEHNTYLYLVNNYTHWLYFNELETVKPWDEKDQVFINGKYKFILNGKLETINDYIKSLIKDGLLLEPQLFMPSNIYFAVYVDGDYRQVVSVLADNEEQAERRLCNAGWNAPVRLDQMNFSNNVCVMFNGR